MTTLRQDDLDGTIGPDVKNHVFTFAGEEYDIDLGPANHAVLRTLLQPFMIRKTSSPTPEVTIRTAEPISPTQDVIRSRMAPSNHRQGPRRR